MVAAATLLLDPYAPDTSDKAVREMALDMLVDGRDMDAVTETLVARFTDVSAARIRILVEGADLELAIERETERGDTW